MLQPTEVLDMDEVIASLIDPFLVFYNNRFHTNLTRQDITRYNLYENPKFGGTRQRAVDLIFEFYKSSEFEQLPAVQGAISGVRRLARNRRVVIASARPKQVYQQTLNWLASKGILNMLNEVYTIGNYTNMPKGIGKLEICQKANAKRIIEDNLETAVDCALMGIGVTLLDTPWNQEKNYGIKQLPDGIVRVHSWDEIV